MERVITLTEVRTFQTPNGNVRFVARDEEGNEYTTFRADIGKRAKDLEQRRVGIEFHKERRGRYENVYLDRITPADQADPDIAAPGDDSEASEAAWSTAVSAAPWLIGEPDDHEVTPDDLYDRLKPFQERVANDIEQGTASDNTE